MSYINKLKKLTEEQQEISKRYDEEKKKEIEKLAEKRTKLTQKRQQEVLKLITDTGALDIDNQLLCSVLLFLKNPANNAHPFIQELLQVTNKQKKSKPKSKEEDSRKVNYEVNSASDDE